MSVYSERPCVFIIVDYSSGCSDFCLDVQTVCGCLDGPSNLKEMVADTAVIDFENLGFLGYGILIFWAFLKKYLRTLICAGRLQKWFKEYLGVSPPTPRTRIYSWQPLYFITSTPVFLLVIRKLSAPTPDDIPSSLG